MAKFVLIIAVFVLNAQGFLVREPTRLFAQE
jgi:hypothetical protein